MQTTTEFRSHWIDAAGRRYEHRYPYTAHQLTPVVNLGEVRAWLDVACSDAMRRARFPGSIGSGDPAYHGMHLVLDLTASDTPIPGHLAQALCDELTDDIPRYHQSSDADWRTPFVQMRERWPLPVLGGIVEIRNLTPHDVKVNEVTFDPSGVFARVIEEANQAAPIRLSIPDPHGAPADRITFDVPTSTTCYTGIVDLPAPQPGIYLIVSMVVMQEAGRRGRWVGDLLVPGEQVRDVAGRIVGCRSLARAV